MRATRCSFYGPLGPRATRLSIAVACGSREESTRGGSVARSGDQLLSSRCAIGRRRSLACSFVRSFVRVASLSFLSLLSSLHSSFLFSSFSSFLFFLFSLYPFWTFSFPLTPRAVRACVRARTKVRTKGIRVYNANRGPPCGGQHTTTRQRRVAPRPLSWCTLSPQSLHERSRVCTYTNTYVEIHVPTENAPYILAHILIHIGEYVRVHVRIYRCMYLGLPVDPSGFASPRTYTRSRGNGRTANERASE